LQSLAGHNIFVAWSWSDMWASIKNIGNTK
jgi:hypothetical protein